jgi:hypothetical protein
MTRKRILLVIILGAVLAVGYFGRTMLLRSVGLLPPELSKEEVRHLLAGLQLPESLNPDAVHAVLFEEDSRWWLDVHIRLKGAHANELLDPWLQEASRTPSSDSSSHESSLKSSLLPLRSDDIFVFKHIKERRNVNFLVRKRDAGVDIHCMFSAVPAKYLSKELRVLMWKGRVFEMMIGQGTTCERQLGKFGSD